MNGSSDCEYQNPSFYHNLSIIINNDQRSTVFADIENAGYKDSRSSDDVSIR